MHTHTFDTIRTGVISGLLAAVPLTVAAQPGGIETDSACAVVVPFTEERGGWANTHDNRFFASEMLDLYFDVGLSQLLDGVHVVELELYTPNGYLYQVLAQPVTWEREQEGLRVHVPGYPDPVEVQVLNRRTQAGQVRWIVRFRLPVAGTSIITSSLYGMWEARPQLDGNPISCGRTFRFGIEP